MAIFAFNLLYNSHIVTIILTQQYILWKSISFLAGITKTVDLKAVLRKGSKLNLKFFLTLHKLIRFQYLKDFFLRKQNTLHCVLPLIIKTTLVWPGYLQNSMCKFFCKKNKAIGLAFQNTLDVKHTCKRVA